MSTVVPTLAPRRVTVVAPETRVDVTLPAQALVADVLHQLVVLIAGSRPGSRPVDPGGWVIMLLAGQTLDDEVTIAQAGVRDGDVLYLRPRVPTVPAPLFDDVVDAVAMASGARYRWGPGASRAAALVAAAVVVSLGVPVLLFAGPPWGRPAVVAALAAAMLLGAATLLHRALDRPVQAAVSLGFALVYSALAGGLALASGDLMTTFGAAQLLIGSVVTGVTAGVALLLVPGRVPLLAFVIGAAGAGALLAVADLTLAQSASRVAAVGLTVLILFQPALPTLAMRLGRVPFPDVPRDLAQFRELNSVTVGEAALAAGYRAEQFFAAVLLSAGVIASGCVAVLASADSRWARWLAVTAVVSLMLRSRQVRSTVPKAVILATGGVGAIIAFASIAPTWSVGLRLGLLVLAVTAAVVAVVLIERQPPRRPSPHRGRWLDIAEIISLVTILPLVVGVLGLYGRLRGLGG
jgi:type VII secretion integral membrane protein EccD